MLQKGMQIYSMLSKNSFFEKVKTWVHEKSYKKMVWFKWQRKTKLIKKLKKLIFVSAASYNTQISLKDCLAEVYINLHVQKSCITHSRYLVQKPHCKADVPQFRCQGDAGKINPTGYYLVCKVTKIILFHQWSEQKNNLL